MNKQKIKIVLLCIFCIFCILLSTTMQIFMIYTFVSPFIISPQEYEMLRVSSAVIPDYYWGNHTWLNVKERDSYGRYLFLSSFSDMGTDYYMIIVQASQDGKASYYAETCILTTDSWRDIPDEAYEAFKEQNDWGKPLNYEKMTWCEID